MEKEPELGLGKSKTAAKTTGEGGGAAVLAAETLLRVVPIGLCLAALSTMLKNSQINDFGSVSYSNVAAFMYLAYANGVCAGYSLLSAFIVAARRPLTVSRAWTVFFFDQVLTYVILAAAMVSAEIIYLAYNGDTEVTWSKECGVFRGFCRRATASVAITFVAVLCYVVVSLLSAYRLFSSYDAPVNYMAANGAVRPPPLKI